MIEAEKERKSATAALDNVERQVKSQQKLSTMLRINWLPPRSR